MKRLISILLFIISLSGLGYTQNVTVLPLDSILLMIQRENPGLQSYDLRSQAFVYQADAATAWRAPMVGLGTFMTPFPGQKKTNSMTRGSIMLEMEQEFPNLSLQKINKMFVESQADIEKKEKEIAYNNLKAEARILYYTWIITKKKLHFLKINSEIFDMVKKIAEIRYQYNQVSLGEIYKTDMAIRENQDNIFIAKKKTAEIKAYLKSLMNRKDSSDFEVDTTNIPIFKVHAYDRSELAHMKKDIHKIDAMLTTLSYNLKAIQSEALPQGKIRFAYMQPISPIIPIMYSAMGMVSIPIVPWAAKSYKNSKKAVEVNRLALQREKENTLIKAQGNLTALQYQIESAEEKITGMENVILPALRKNLDADIKAYQENKLQLPVVMRDWSVWNMMQINLLNEQLSFYKMIVNYDKELYR